MPSGSRSKEDTWKAEDLGSALHGKKDGHRRSDDRKRSDKDVRDPKKTDKGDDRERRERKHREKTDRDGKERVRDKDRDRDREKGHNRDKDRDRDRDRDRHDREKGGREKERSDRHRSKQEPENGEKRREKSTAEKTDSRGQVSGSRSNDDRHHRRPREDGERRSEDKERQRRPRDEEGKERKHRSHREREEEGGRSKRPRDGDVERKRSKDEQGDDRKHKSHRDRDADKSKRRPSDKVESTTTRTKPNPDVAKKESKPAKPTKAPAETKEDDILPSGESKIPGDKPMEPEDVSEGHDKWRESVAMAAESRERHSSQECVRASSSSMSGDILEDFSFSDDIDQIAVTLHDNASTERKPAPPRGDDENFAKWSSEITKREKKVSPTKPPQPGEKSTEVNPEPSDSKSTVKKLTEGVNTKGKLVKQTSSKVRQSDYRAHVGSGSSVSLAKNNSPPKKGKHHGSVDSGKAPTTPKGLDALKTLTTKIYLNSGRKDSINREHASPRQQHMSPRQGSVTSVNQEKHMSPRRSSVTSVTQEKHMSPRRSSVTSVNQEKHMSPRKGSVTSVNQEKHMSPRKGSVTSVNQEKHMSPRRGSITSVNQEKHMSPRKGSVTSVNQEKHISPRKGSITSVDKEKDMSPRRSSVTSVKQEKHMSPRKGSVTSANQEKKTNNTTPSSTSVNSVTKPVLSPRGASLNDAGSKSKSGAKGKNLSLKSSAKEMVRDSPETKETHFQQSRAVVKQMLPTETPVVETAAVSLPTHKASHSKVAHRGTVRTAELLSAAKPTGTELNRRTSIGLAENKAQAVLAAKSDVAGVPRLKDDSTRTKENVAGSKDELHLKKTEERSHNRKDDIDLKPAMEKHGADGALVASKSSSHKVKSGQKAGLESETQQSLNSDIRRRKTEKNDTITASVYHSAPSKERLEQNQASRKPKDNEVMSEKHKKKPHQNQNTATSKDKEMMREKHKEQHKSMDRDEKHNETHGQDLASTKQAKKVSPRLTSPTRPERGDTPVPELVPGKTTRRDRLGSGGVRARAPSARAASALDKEHTLTVSPDLKEHSSCETIPDDVSEGHNSLDLVRKLKKGKKKEELAEDNDDYNYDDEEFEDYDDDFEDDDEEDDDEEDEDEASRAKASPPSKEMDELLSALDQENERLLHSAKYRQTADQNGATEQPSRTANDRSPSNRRTFINFSSARESQMSGAAASKARRRGNDLLKMIELDVAHYELFDMPPVNEYELYMRSFGCSNTRQAYVQTNDDNIECETQTEEAECSDKWCQHPPEDFVCTGGDDDTKDSEEPERKPTDPAKLGKFLLKASQVITMLLEEEFSEISTRDGPIKNQSNIVLSESFVQLETSALTKDRHVAFSYFSPLQTKFLLTVYSKPHTVNQQDRLSNCGLICVWNVGEPTHPEKVLVCESMPRCCCFSPGKASLVFAGMHDGSLAVWDLSEASSLHRTHSIGDKDWLLRYPTYNTAGVLHHENHHSSVVQVTPIVATGDSAQASLSGDVGGGAGDGMSFQLASLEEHAVLHLWVVAEIMHPDLAGSESDLGLLPGGKVKLVKSSSIQLENPIRMPTVQTAMQALDLCLLPQNNSHFYVATDTGTIIHGVRYGGKAPPKAYRAQADGLMRVTSLDFSPFCEPTFLAGCADGSVRLYTTESEYPLMTWPEATEGAASVVWVRWCRSRPSVFFVLDTNALLYIWDLLMDDLQPLKQEKVADARVTSFALSNDYSATGCGTPGRKPQMVMCLENGATEVHSISREFSAMMPDEIDQFSQYLQKVI